MIALTRRQVLAGGAAAVAVVAAPASAQGLAEEQLLDEIRRRIERAWRAVPMHPERGIITPAEFARLAMAAGLRGSYCAVIEGGRLVVRRGA